MAGGTGLCLLSSNQVLSVRSALSLLVAMFGEKELVAGGT